MTVNEQHDTCSQSRMTVQGLTTSRAVPSPSRVIPASDFTSLRLCPFTCETGIVLVLTLVVLTRVVLKTKQDKQV